MGVILIRSESVRGIIARYQLVPHPEGGFYREVYRSDLILDSPTVEEKRCALTHIYFLLAAGQVSRFHRVLHDEVWNFYAGDPLLLIRYDGRQATENLLGAEAGDFVTTIKGGVFQAAESTGAYSLVGCTVAPGFEFADFSFLADDSAKKARFLQGFTAYRRFV